MTPEDRAHQLWMNYLNDQGHANWTQIELRNKIAAAIREAVAGSIKAHHDNHHCYECHDLECMDDADSGSALLEHVADCNFCQKAKAEAYEEAAKILEGDVLKTPDEFDGKTKIKVFDLLERLAIKIRARAKELLK